MSGVRRVVFDTSTLVGVALKPGSTPHRALGLALQQCEVCMSAATLDELDEVLSRATRLALAALLRLHTIQIEVTPADEAEVLVSSDDDLLTLHPWCGVQVITPAAFVAMLAPLVI